jgi:hypothetical protein
MAISKEIEKEIKNLPSWKQKILREDIIEAIKNRVKVLKNAR